MSKKEKRKSNKSKTYILPYMAKYLNVKFVDKIIDTFCFYEDGYNFCLLYEFSGKRSFIDYEDELKNNELFVDSIDIGRDKVLYIFDYPDEIFDLLNLFFDGKYSYLPDIEIIKKFLTFHFKLRKNHRIFHILDRSELLRQSLEKELDIKIPLTLDLADPPDKETEVFKLRNYEQKRKHSVLSTQKPN